MKLLLLSLCFHFGIPLELVLELLEASLARNIAVAAAPAAAIAAAEHTPLEALEPLVPGAPVVRRSSSSTESVSP